MKTRILLIVLVVFARVPLTSVEVFDVNLKSQFVGSSLTISIYNTYLLRGTLVSARVIDIYGKTAVDFKDRILLSNRGEQVLVEELGAVASGVYIIIIQSERQQWSQTILRL